VEQVILHEQHVWDWLAASLMVDMSPMPQPPIVAGLLRKIPVTENELRIETPDEIGYYTPANVSAHFVPIPPVWEGTEAPFTEIKQEPNLAEKGWSWPIDVDLRNPHNVTPEQVGLGLIKMTCTYGPDPNVIDVEARVVETPKELPAPKGEEDE